MEFIIYIFFLLHLIYLFNNINNFKNYYKILTNENNIRNFYNYINNKYLLNNDKQIVNTKIDNIKSSIIFNVNHKTLNNNDTVSALLYYLQKLNSSRDLNYINNYYITNTSSFDINKDIKCKILDFKYNQNNNELEKYKLKLYSYNIELNNIKEFLNNIEIEYNKYKNYKLGLNQYYFNEIIQMPPKKLDNDYNFNILPKNFIFKMTKFETNRSLNNIFGKHLTELKNRINIFINKPLWFKEKGLPYTLGILLSGPPGTGKTSIIKGIAKDTNRHIININLRDYTTTSQLYNLFTQEEIVVKKSEHNNNDTEIINIPINKRLYIIEDIDCMSDIVLDREIINFNPHNFYNTENNTANDKENIELHNDLIIDDSEVKLNNSNDTDEIQISDSVNVIENINNNNLENEYNKLCEERNKDLNKDMNKDLNKDMNNEENMTLSEELNNNKLQKDMENNEELANSIEYKKFTYIMNRKEFKDNLIKENPEKLSLSDLLNILDGVIESHGRIIIITSNHPYVLDSALLRPGRIDLQIETGYCDPEMIKDMFNFFYKTNYTIDKFNNFKSNLTPAQINNIFLNNSQNPDNAILNLNNY